MKKFCYKEKEELSCLFARKKNLIYIRGMRMAFIIVNAECVLIYKAILCTVCFINLFQERSRLPVCRKKTLNGFRINIL